MPFPWNFRRQTLFKDDRVVQTELLTAKMYEHFMAMKEHISYKADTTRLRSRTQNICFFISISAVSYFEANGQNHIHFRLIQVLKKTSNRTAENLPQRKLWAAHDARSQRGIWSHRTSARACFFGNDRSSHSRVRTRLITKSVFYEWASDSFAYPCPCNHS